MLAMRYGTATREQYSSAGKLKMSFLLSNVTSRGGPRPDVERKIVERYKEDRSQTSKGTYTRARTYFSYRHIAFCPLERRSQIAEVNFPAKVFKVLSRVYSYEYSRA